MAKSIEASCGGICPPGQVSFAEGANGSVVVCPRGVVGGCDSWGENLITDKANSVKQPQVTVTDKPQDSFNGDPNFVPPGINTVDWI